VKNPPHRLVLVVVLVLVLDFTRVFEEEDEDENEEDGTFRAKSAQNQIAKAFSVSYRPAMPVYADTTTTI